MCNITISLIFDSDIITFKFMKLLYKWNLITFNINHLCLNILYLRQTINYLTLIQANLICVAGISFICFSCFNIHITCTFSIHITWLFCPGIRISVTFSDFFSFYVKIVTLVDKIIHLRKIIWEICFEICILNAHSLKLKSICIYKTPNLLYFVKFGHIYLNVIYKIQIIILNHFHCVIVEPMSRKSGFSMCYIVYINYY